MRARSDLFPLQVEAVRRIAERRRLALLVPLGHGKTAIALTALSDLGAWPALVVAPQRVAREVWGAEPLEWEHLQNIVVRHVGDDLRAGRGRELRLGAAPALDDVAHAETVSYENLWWLTEHVDLSERYRAIVFDELDKMKDPGSKRFRRMRSRRCMDVPIRIGQCAHPVGNHLLDLWGEMFMVAGEEPLGSSFSAYQSKYFEAEGYQFKKWGLKHSPSCHALAPAGGCCALSKECEGEIHRRCAPHCYSIPPQPGLVPPVVASRVVVPWPAKVRKIAEELERQFFSLLDSGVELEALGASAVAQKLRQLAGGAAYTDGEAWEPVHGAKLNAFRDAVERLQGAPALVGYWYKHERERLGDLLTDMKIEWSDDSDPHMTERWNRGDLEVLLVQPQSAGHGLNLQHGGSTVIWYTLPFSGALVSQLNGRLARVGQRAPTVSAISLLCGPGDERVADIVDQKVGADRRFLEGVRG